MAMKTENYRDIVLLKMLDYNMGRLRMPQSYRSSLMTHLELIKNKHRGTYLHSLTVGICTANAARYLGIPEESMLIPSFLHDFGKLDMDINILKKTTPLTAKEHEEKKKHPLAGYNYLKELYPLDSQVILLHHRHQPKPYPDIDENSFPKDIQECSKAVSLVDAFDSLTHRNNSFANNKEYQDREKIKKKMKEIRPMLYDMASELIDKGILRKLL
ncbi:MAG TPA: hypothetical protein VJB11_02845 [archaeon]|nr:hypothetical protein [archaeon]